MAETETDLLKLVKPEVGGSPNVWGQRLNEDLDKLDAKFVDLSGVLKTSGASVTYTLSASGPNFLKTGASIRAQFHVANGPAPTLSINALAPKPLFYVNPSGVEVAVPAGLLRSGETYDIAYSETANTTGAYLVTNASIQPVFTGGAEQLAATFKSTSLTGTLVNFETSGVVTGALTASATGLSISTGPSGQTLQLLDSGYLEWSGNRHKISGTSPGVELVESDISSLSSIISLNNNILTYQHYSQTGPRFSLSPSGLMTVNATGSNAISASSNAGYALEATSTSTHGIYGRTGQSGSAGVVGYNSAGTVAGFLGLDGFGLYSAGVTYSSGGYQSPSDERLKENINDAPLGDILDLIQRLRVVEFDWRENTDAYNIGKRRTIGLIAQEVEDVLPQIILPVTAPAPMEGQTATLNQQLGEFLSIDSGPLIYYLLAAVQQLASQAGLAAVKTFKADVRRRMTPDENDAFTAALENASSLMRGLWYDVQYLDHNAAEFTEFKDSMVAAFGADRADAILAPST